MKQINYLMVTTIALVLISCGTSKQVTTQEPPQAVGFGQEVSVPCSKESYDDKNYFRGLGTGTSVNIGNSRTAALRSAQNEIQLKIGGFVNGLASSYNRTVAGEQGENTQRLMEDEIVKVVERMLDDALKVCEKTLQDQRGTFNSFIVLEVPKKEMITEMENSLSENEELKTEFNREQFRKFAEEKMSKMEKAENNQ